MHRIVRTISGLVALSMPTVVACQDSSTAEDDETLHGATTTSKDTTDSGASTTSVASTLGVARMTSGTTATSGTTSTTGEPEPNGALPSCGAPTRGEQPVIDDFEDGDLEILPGEQRQGRWTVLDDETAGMVSINVEPDSGGQSLHVEGGGFQAWGAYVYSPVGFDPTYDSLCFYDASAYSGIRFRARGTGQVRFALDDRDTLQSAYGGTCTLGEICFDRPGATIELTSEWTTYEYAFCDLRPEGWGGSKDFIDPKALFSLSFLFSPQQDFEAWIDDIEYVRTTGSSSDSCGPVCPIDEAPAGVSPAPDQTSIDPEATGVRLATFDQSTDTCGPITRRYLYYAPPSLPSGSDAPVLFVLHGTGGDAESTRGFMTRERFETLADRDDFIVVYGNAAPSYATDPARPNSGSWRDDPSQTGAVDDHAYFDLVVADLVDRGVVSGSNPLLLTGLSNGAAMVLSAAFVFPQRFVGIAPINPGFAWTAPAPSAQTSVRRMLWSYSIDDPGVYPEFHDVVAPMPAQWAAALGLTDAPAEQLVPNTVFEGENYDGDEPIALATRNSQPTQLDYTSPDSNIAVRTFIFDHAGHFWPVPTHADPATVVARYGYRNQDLDMSDAVWSFLSSGL